MSNNTHPALLEATVKHGHDKYLTNLGREMFDMYNSGGFPPDMFMTELEKIRPLDQLTKVYIVSIYQDLSLNHRKKSGLQDKYLNKISRRNREVIERLITTGEVGVY